MEDRYLFKGKIKAESTGYEELDWAIGNLVVEHRTGRYYIVDLEHFDDSTKLTEVMIEVEPSTICQCTGLKDKNGKLIWENDILHYKWDVDRIDFVEYRAPIFTYSGSFRWSLHEDEVIGNRFDNLELLEVQE